MESTLFHTDGRMTKVNAVHLHKRRNYFNNPSTVKWQLFEVIQLIVNADTSLYIVCIF